jgi:hypothetical protein
MCGRYYRRSDKQAIAEHFRVRNDLSGLVLPDADYNVAPRPCSLSFAKRVTRRTASWSCAGASSPSSPNPLRRERYQHHQRPRRDHRHLRNLPRTLQTSPLYHPCKRVGGVRLLVHKILWVVIGIWMAWKEYRERARSNMEVPLFFDCDEESRPKAALTLGLLPLLHRPVTTRHRLCIRHVGQLDGRVVGNRDGRGQPVDRLTRPSHDRQRVRRLRITDRVHSATLACTVRHGPRRVRRRRVHHRAVPGSQRVSRC